MLLSYLDLNIYPSFDVEMEMFAIKMINLNAKVSAKKTKADLIFKIDNNGIHIKMSLIK